jgi:hypothetical protein
MVDELTDVSEAEERNRLVSVQRLGDTLTLAQDLFDAHAKLGELLGSTVIEDGEWMEVVSALVLGVRYQLVIGALAVLRAHPTEASQSIRRAAEMAAVAHRISLSPELRDLWVRYDRDDATFKRYRREFRAELLFPETDPLLRKLYDRYDRGSKVLHSSITSLARRVAVETTDDWRSVRVNYFEFAQDDKGEPQRSFLYLVDSHYGILQVFTRIFEAQLGDLKGQWELQMNSIADKYRVHLHHWAPTF